MLSCSHDRPPFGAPMCDHLRAGREASISYVRWYTGVGIDTELLCKVCVDDRQLDRPIHTDTVCQVCFKYATSAVGDLEGVRGKPQVRTRPEPFDLRLSRTALPTGLGRIIDVSPISESHSSIWLLLADDGAIARIDAASGEWKQLATTTLVPEPDHDPWCDRVLKRRLHASPCGRFAAVVNDYGDFGQILDLGSGRVTLELNGGDDEAETVPFSFAFARVRGRVVAVHRTAWNRLDVSDPSSGALLTARGPTGYQNNEDRPAHYLDYFHGALHVSPNGSRIADDGWFWHPVGIPSVWSLERWVYENVWESEDGLTRTSICARDNYWDNAMTWLDDRRIAIRGIGEDDASMIDGVRIFDLSLSGSGVRSVDDGGPWPREVATFAGPAGEFFSDGQFLFSFDNEGLSRWDVNDGSRTGKIQGFKPTHYHRGARECVQVVDNALVRGSL